MSYSTYEDKLKLSKTSIAEVTIADRRERLSWIRTPKLSVSLVVSEQLTEDGKVHPPMLLASLFVDEGEENVKALLRDYVRRQNDPVLTDPIPLRRLQPIELQPDDEIELDAPEPVLFGAPK